MNKRVTTRHFKIIIVGAGFSGLCMGIQLKRSGIDDFLILESASELGGTWRDNTYPGAECDIPSALYSYSFEHNAAWEYKWSGQAQILKYQQDTTAKYGLTPHLQYNSTVRALVWSDEQCMWSLTTEADEHFTAQHVVVGVGQLHHPYVPHIDGAEQYLGEQFHSARWQHNTELVGKRVAVIGCAASAVQFVPEIAKQVDSLTVFQRSPNWILPKQDRPYARFEQWVSDKFPPITKLYRLLIWLKGEVGVLPAIKGNRILRFVLRGWNQLHMRKTIKDAELRKKLTPNYPVGAKRILFADEYYSTLARDNVELCTIGIARFTEQGLCDTDGVERLFDVVIYATGFKTNPFLAHIDVFGSAGKSLKDHWSDGAFAYRGVTTHGFPNFFMMYGPNTNLGHNSIILMIEAQAKYIYQAVTGLDDRADALCIEKVREQEYNQQLQDRLKPMAFAQVTDSWYLDHGKSTNNWAGGTREYWRALRVFDWQNYQLTNKPS